MELQLERKDIRLILICVGIAAIGLLVGTHYFYQAFPEATIDFGITRDRAGELGTSFLQQQGMELEGYRHSTIFRYSDDTKTFLERQLGLQGASEVIDNPVRLWRWSSRWVREQQKEEFRVEYTTGGDLVGFSHIVEEDLEGASLSQIEARYLAEQFLLHAMGRAMSSLVFVEAETTERPRRADHSFTWKLNDFDIDDATYRIRVGIQGDLVGSYAEFLKVPEDWQREFRELRSRNEAAGLVASAFMLFTWVAMVVILAISIRGRDVRWRIVTIFGAVAFVLTLLAQLNSLPVSEYFFETTDTFGSFLTQHLLYSVLGAALQAASIAMIVAGAEPVYRRAYGGQMSLSGQFALTGIRTKRFLLGTIIGLTLTTVFVAYQTVFYLVAGELGAWMPADIPYSEMVNTHIPWAVILLIGFLPAVMEEMTSRAFTIPFLQRYVKKQWLAVLIAAVVWGFAHSSYPQEPFFIRGVEVGIAGIALGYVMIRWGLLPVLVFHYTIDALYTALILLRSSNMYFVVSAALSVGLMLLPLAGAILLYLHHRQFTDVRALLNCEDSPALAEPPPKPSADLAPEARIIGSDETEAGPRAPLTPRRLAVATAIVLASLAIFLKDVEEPLEYVDFAVTPGQAEEIAAAHLADMGVEAETYRVVTTSRNNVDGSALKYRMEREGMAAVDELYRSHLKASLWRVRFFRPLEKEEYHVWINPADSTVYMVQHLVEEEAPGADLEEEEARILAVDHLRSSGLDPDTFELKESSSEKLRERRDHIFVWEAREGDPRNLDESYFRCEVKIAGDEPAYVRRYVKLPESWTREREERTTLRTSLQGVSIVVAIAIFFHMVWLLICRIRSGTIHWRTPVRIGAVTAVVTLLGLFNSLPTYYELYSTETTVGVYAVVQAVQWVLVPCLLALMITVALALMSALYPNCLDSLFSSRSSAEFRDALVIAALVYVGGKSFGHLATLIGHHFARFGSAPGVQSMPGMGSALPFWSGLVSGLQASMAVPIVAGVLLYYALRVLRRPHFIILVLVLLSAALAGGSAINAGEFCLSLAQMALRVGYGVLIVYFLLRDNVLAYALFGFLSTAVDGSYHMASQSAPYYQIHGWIWLILSLLLVLGFWARYHRHPARGAPE